MRFLSLFPPFQLGQQILHERPCGIFILPTHMGNTFLNHFLHGAYTNKIAIGIAPLAVFLIEGTIGLLADEAVICQGHAAALADQILGRTQKGIDGDIKFLGDQLQCLRIGYGLSRFP